MTDAIRVSSPVTGTEKTLSFEAGHLAQLADGAVVARIGDTILLATVAAAKSVREGIDFFPLTVDIEERAYAAGKIPGAFFRREVQVVGTIFSADQENPYDVLAINAASASLMISGIPFEGPIGAVRMAYTTDGEWAPHPTYQEGDAATFELVVAGRALGDSADADVAIMMVEAGGTEGSFEMYADGAPKVSEDVLSAGLEASKLWIRESINLQRELVKNFTAARGPIVPMEYQVIADYQSDVYESVEAMGMSSLSEANKL